jgi:hypothetical protein
VGKFESSTLWGHSDFYNFGAHEGAQILRLVRVGTLTIEAARELIAVREDQEEFLRRRFSQAFVDRILEYRREVARHFERLLKEGQADDEKTNGHRRRVPLARFRAAECPLRARNVRSRSGIELT